jgi:mono/diheme cytochrome c family protein
MLGAGLAQKTEDAAVQAVLKLDGWFIRDEKSAGRPVVAVDFNDTEAMDADLTELAALKTLQTLDLTRTEDQAGSGAVYGADESAPARAVTLFRQLCVRCHGGDGRGRDRIRGAPPDFTNHAWQSRHTNVQLIASIRQGKGNRMPSFTDRLNRAEIAALVALIRRFDSEHHDADSADDFETRFHALEAGFHAQEAEWERQHQAFLRLNARKAR